MSRPAHREYNLKERLQKMQEAGIHLPGEKDIGENGEMAQLPLSERIAKMLNILKAKPNKNHTMTYLIMYDIENNKVRTRVAKYLERKGCVRIQKSIFMVNSLAKEFNEIYETLLEVQSYYENEDSILLVPYNTSDLRSMKIIGKDIHLETIIEKPNTLFF
jgi:CRISPR-associated endonuclease Cas2